MMYEYVIPCPPVTKKNSEQIAKNRKTGKRFIIQSQRYSEYETAASYFLRPKPPKPIDYPVTVKCLFFMPTKRRVDTNNLEAAAHDILVKFGVLADDNRDIIASKDGTRTYQDKENPRTEITITPFTEEYTQWKDPLEKTNAKRK